MFLLMADQKYVHTIGYSIRKIKEIYGDVPILLYDWGIDKTSIEELCEINRNLVVRPWKVRRLATWKDFKFVVGMFWLHKINYLKCLVKKVLGYDQGLSLFRFEQMILQKIKCFIAAQDFFEDEFVFLDADAILNDRVDELFDGQVDFCFTQRRMAEINYSYDYCRGINSGVIYFGKDKRKVKMFLEHWLSRAYATTERIAEQTSLTRILQQFGLEGASYGDVLKVSIPGAEELKAKILACEIYNFNWIEELIGAAERAENVKVLHFKGARHSEKQFGELLGQLDIKNIGGKK